MRTALQVASGSRPVGEAVTYGRKHSAHRPSCPRQVPRRPSSPATMRGRSTPPPLAGATLRSSARSSRTAPSGRRRWSPSAITLVRACSWDGLRCAVPPPRSAAGEALPAKLSPQANAPLLCAYTHALPLLPFRRHEHVCRDGGAVAPFSGPLLSEPVARLRPRERASVHLGSV